MENYLVIQTPSGPMDVFVVSLAGSKIRPTIILFQEAFGVNSHIKEVSRRLARRGFVVLAPELYHRLGRHIVIPYEERKKFMPYMATLTNDTLLEDARACLSLCAELPSTDPRRVFTLGFCLGGFTSLLCATELPLLGSVSFYGAGVTQLRPGLGLSPIIDRFPKLNCPVLLFYGELDSSIPAVERRRIEEALRSAEKDFEIRVMPKSDHGFFCDERGAFNQQTSALAWKKLSTWLDDRLGELVHELDESLGHSGKGALPGAAGSAHP